MAVFLSADVFVFETLLMQLNPWKLYYEFSFFFFFLFKIDLFILLSAPFFFHTTFLNDLCIGYAQIFVNCHYLCNAYFFTISCNLSSGESN